MTVAIMSAMQLELDLLVSELADAVESVSWGGRTYHQGMLWGVPAVLAFSRCLQQQSTFTEFIRNIQLNNRRLS